MPFTEKLVGELGSTFTFEGIAKSKESFRGRIKPFAAIGKEFSGEWYFFGSPVPVVKGHHEIKLRDDKAVTRARSEKSPYPVMESDWCYPVRPHS